ncbi:MAG: hypothetical protein IIW82_01495, partial [Clostridia bacterium]|nr:hypothetical protein [Clostridia bacterium]
QADKRLSDVSIQAVADYYTADSRAEEILAALRAGQLPEDVTKTDGICSYQVTVSPTMELRIEVREDDWKVLRWQVVSTVQWQADESLDLWNGGN